MHIRVYVCVSYPSRILADPRVTNEVLTARRYTTPYRAVIFFPPIYISVLKINDDRDDVGTYSIVLTCGALGHEPLV